jgi:hypothetical protein
VILLRALNKTGEIQYYSITDTVASPAKGGPQERPRRSRAWHFKGGIAVYAHTMSEALRMLEKERDNALVGR